MSATTYEANKEQVWGEDMHGGRTSTGMAQPAESTPQTAPPTRTPPPHHPCSTHRAWRSRAGAPWTAACLCSPADQCSWTAGAWGAGQRQSISTLRHSQHWHVQTCQRFGNVAVLGAFLRLACTPGCSRPTIPRPHRKVNSASQSWPLVKALQSQASPVADRVGAATTWLNTSSRCCPPVVRGGRWEWKVWWMKRRF